ncbi:hypothetical protein IWW50_004114 [Coemansia erecta]|nr:hypothetical protein IWW50_004114 [Coemansia erecta]
MSSEVLGAENKRKRQESIQGNEILQKDEDAVSGPASPDNNNKDEVEDEEDVEEEAEQEQEQEQPEGSSPAKRPRTSEDGDDNDDEDEEEEDGGVKDIKEDNTVKEDTAKESAAATDTPQRPANPVDTTRAPVFGMTFASTQKLGGFAAAAKKPSALSAFGRSSATSGFAQYAKAEPIKSPGIAPAPIIPLETTTTASVDNDDKGDTDDKGDKAPLSARTFEDMLTAEGKESLATNAAMSAMVPAMAHANVAEQLATLAPVRTHEEDETCEFATKAKLFELAQGAWKERGGGQFKVNRRNDDQGKCRLVMRTDQTFRLILNVPLFAGMRVTCEGRFVRFTCFDTETMALATFALRFPTDGTASDAYVNVTSAIPTKEEEEEEEEEAVVETSGDRKGKGKDVASSKQDEDDGSDDSEEDEDYEESGSESDDNVLDSDAEETGSEDEDEDEDGQQSNR